MENREPAGTPEPGAVPLSDPQEIPYLPRREGPVWKESAVDKAVRDFLDMLDDGDKEAGRRVWRRGDKLVELYNGFPERAKGVPSFMQFATRTFRLTRQDVDEFMRARRRIENADDAAKLGRKRIRLAFRLLDRLGIETLETLAERDLALKDGTSCRFPATTEQLEEALELLGDKGAPQHSRRLLSEAARKNEAFAEAKREVPALSNVRAVFVVEDHEVVLKNGPLTKDQRVALATFILELEGGD